MRTPSLSSLNMRPLDSHATSQFTIGIVSNAAALPRVAEAMRLQDRSPLMAFIKTNYTSPYALRILSKSSYKPARFVPPVSHPLAFFAPRAICVARRLLSQQCLSLPTLLLLCSIVISGFIGCDSPNTPKQAYETLVFNVDETLLEPTVVDTTLRIKIASPKNWTKIDNSMRQQVINTLDTEPIQGLQIAPRWVFLNKGSGAMCVVSKLNSVEISPDETLLETLTIAYQNQFPNATVRQAIFMKDAFRIHQLMVIATDFVRIKLICDALETLVFEVDYHIPRDVYESELRAIESSIGSINLIQK